MASKIVHALEKRSDPRLNQERVQEAELLMNMEQLREFVCLENRKRTLDAELKATRAHRGLEGVGKPSLVWIGQFHQQTGRREPTILE